jgi:hypothetical protein
LLAVKKVNGNNFENYVRAVPRGARSARHESNRIGCRSLGFQERHRRFREGPEQPTKNNLAAIQRVLEEAGVEFTNGDAPGLRLRKKKR